MKTTTQTRKRARAKKVSSRDHADEDEDDANANDGGGARERRTKEKRLGLGHERRGSASTSGNDVESKDNDSNGVDMYRGEKRLTYVPLAAWAIALASASAFSSVGKRLGENSSSVKQAFVTDWFDDIFVAYGPALPLFAMGARAMLKTQTREIGRELAKETWTYVAVASLRLMTYATLRAAFPRAFISDHVFLGASVFSAAHGEFLSCAVDFATLVERRGNPVFRTGVMLVGAYALALMSATLALCFTTARWFHHPFDTACAVLFGWGFLQLPLTAVVIRPRARELATALAL